MEQKHIIIILLIVVVVLAAAMAVMILSPSVAKQETQITITSNETVYEGDNLTFKLTDINGTGISNQTVNVTLKDNDGVSSYFSAVTDSKGIGTLKLDKSAGNYAVNVTFAGNDNYTGSTASQDLEIKEEVVEQPAAQQSSSSSSNGGGLHYDKEINVYYNDEGVIVDPDGEHPQGVGSSYSDARDARDRWERGEPVMV